MLPLSLTLSWACAALGQGPTLVPELKGKQRDPTKIGHQSIEIHLPWEDAGYLELRFPETLRCDLGLLFIDHVRADMPPVVRIERLPDWVRNEETGALSYEIKLPNRVSFGAVATPVDGRVDLEFWVRNETEQPLTRLHTQFCVVQTKAPPFSEGQLTQTYIHSDGKWLALADTTHEVMNPERGPWILTAVGEGGIKPHTKLEGCWYCCPERGDASIVVDKRHLRLTLWLDGKFLREYAIGIGREASGGETPPGRFKIGSRIDNPRWYRRGKPPLEFGDPGNILGTRWLGFRQRGAGMGIGIHGSHDGEGVGQRASAGCIRMHNRDVEELYDFAKVGTPVEIIE